MDSGRIWRNYKGFLKVGVRARIETMISLFCEFSGLSVGSLLRELAEKVRVLFYSI